MTSTDDLVREWIAQNGSPQKLPEGPRPKRKPSRRSNRFAVAKGFKSGGRLS